MPKTQVTCPRCHQPVLVEMQQIFDMVDDPLAKQKLLSNASNIISCPACQYQGMLPVPIVYHDPEKEILLTFFPPDLNTPVNEQEKQIGPLINRIMDKLPQEKRKAYFLQPKNMLTFQSMIEKILEADGITKEMLQEQQTRISLIEKLIPVSKENRSELIKQEIDIIDNLFFSILARIIQSAMNQGDQSANQPLIDLQTQLFEETETGRQLFTQAKETESAIKILQDAGKEGLTREKLLDICINNSSDIQISTIASLARNGIDYEFFKLLSEKIEQENNKERKEELRSLREKLLEITEEIDKQLQEELQKSRDLLNRMISSENIEGEVEKNISQINELFIQVLQSELSAARKESDLEKIQKLERVMIVIEKASAPPEEIKLIETLLEYKDQEDLDRLVEENKENINQEFLEMMNNIVGQFETQTDQAEAKEQIRNVYKAVLRYSMKANMNG